MINEEDKNKINITRFKDLPFAKSWQNAYVSKTHNILNTETGTTAEKTFDDFIFIPGPTLVRHFSSVNEFLAFRNEHKSSEDWDYKLIDDKFENQNRRLAIFYISIFLNELNIHFEIDKGYGIYIEVKELAEKAKNEDPTYKEIYNHVAIPTSIAKRSGAVESWGG